LGSLEFSTGCLFESLRSATIGFKFWHFCLIHFSL